MLYHHRCPSFRGERGESEGITKYICFFLLIKKTTWKGNYWGPLDFENLSLSGCFLKRMPPSSHGGFQSKHFSETNSHSIGPQPAFFFLVWGGRGGGLESEAIDQSKVPWFTSLLPLSSLSFCHLILFDTRSTWLAPFSPTEDALITQIKRRGVWGEWQSAAFQVLRDTWLDAAALNAMCWFDQQRQGHRLICAAGSRRQSTELSVVWSHRNMGETQPVAAKSFRLRLTCPAWYVFLFLPSYECMRLFAENRPSLQAFYND